jgi:uncharacterized membrane protein
MGMTPRVRKLALTAHVVASVGWLGAVAAFLALAVAALTSEDPQTIRSMNNAMKLSGWSVLVPLSVASLLTGLVQSLGTAWGLFRHYWVVTKLVLNVLATAVLLLYMRTLSDLADLTQSSPSPVLHSGAALLLLVTATVLAVYKPRGLTRYGRRKLG